MSVLRAMSEQRVKYANRKSINMLEDNTEKIYDTFNDEEMDDIVEAFNPNVKVTHQFCSHFNFSLSY